MIFCTSCKTDLRVAHYKDSHNCDHVAGRYVSGHEHLQIVDRNEAVSKCILQINSGKFQEADATLTSILKKEPTCYQALVARGTCRALAGSTSPTELKKADADFGKALEQMPLLADVWKRRSQARAALGNTDGAAKDLEQCLAKYASSAPQFLQHSLRMLCPCLLVCVRRKKGCIEKNLLPVLRHDEDMVGKEGSERKNGSATGVCLSLEQRG